MPKLFRLLHIHHRQHWMQCSSVYLPLHISHQHIQVHSDPRVATPQLRAHRRRHHTWSHLVLTISPKYHQRRQRVETICRMIMGGS
jgi:hypothetical protein